MNIEREEFMRLIVFSYNKGFKDAGLIIGELSEHTTLNEEIKQKLEELLPESE